MNTVLKYMDNQDLYEDQSKVLETGTRENGRNYIVLDQTILYPQGGGQPYDKGHIGDFRVEEVRFEDGIVYHIGEGKMPSVNEEVSCKVDIPRRKLNERYHTAGHLIDYALKELGYKWKPLRGHHTPGEGYVKYDGASEDESFLAILQAKIDEMIDGNGRIEVRMSSLEDLARWCDYVPDYLPKDKPVRVVIIWLDEERFDAIPCGGTHVAELKDLGKLEILKAKVKKGGTKISYSCK